MPMSSFGVSVGDVIYNLHMQRHARAREKCLLSSGWWHFVDDGVGGTVMPL